MQILGGNSSPTDLVLVLSISTIIFVPLNFYLYCMNDQLSVFIRNMKQEGITSNMYDFSLGSFKIADVV